MAPLLKLSMSAVRWNCGRSPCSAAAPRSETTLARRRELGAREEVDELIKAHALTRAIARRMKGLKTAPTSPEALAEALKEGDESMSREARRAEASAMRGAFPGNRPCPCGSTKKFKRCCGA